MSQKRLGDCLRRGVVHKCPDCGGDALEFTVMPGAGLCYGVEDGSILISCEACCTYWVKEEPGCPVCGDTRENPDGWECLGCGSV